MCWCAVRVTIASAQFVELKKDEPSEADQKRIEEVEAKKKDLEASDGF
jgi:hypothetical protein